MLIVLLFLSACNLVRVAPPDGSVVPDAGENEATRIAQSVEQTLDAAQPDVPGEPSLTPSITLSPTPEVPHVTVSVETNCRSGPGTPYDILGVLQVGQSAEVIGRNASSDTWIIKLPSNPAVTCWLWGYYATVVGNTSGLTVYTPPPTPTPAAAFTLSYLSTAFCGVYGFRIQITNVGSVTFSSYQMVTLDNTTATTTTYMEATFTDYTGCGGFASQLQDIEPGEMGVAGNWGGSLGYDPSGHSITTTFKLCSTDTLTGTCAERSITFTP
jgi:hypothetical protein